MDRVLVLLVVLAVTGTVSAWWRSRDGRVVPVRLPGPSGTGSTDHPSAADIAAAVGSTTALTLVAFTAPGCQPCVRARAVLDRAVADRVGVGVVAIDVGEALDLARSHRILRAPTTLLVDRRGHLLGRIAGVPRPDELAELLDRARRRVPTG